MSAGVRVPLADAAAVADELVAVLALGCERIAVAGSIRRGQPDVGDVELVAIPRFHEAADGFWRTTPVNELDVLLDRLVLGGTLEHSPRFGSVRGPRYSKFVHRASGLQVDLFSCRRDTWGLILLIRTGPRDYSMALVTEARRRGYHVAEGELHVGGLGRDDHGPCIRVPTPEEADVYAALRLPFVEPEARA